MVSVPQRIFIFFLVYTTYSELSLADPSCEQTFLNHYFKDGKNILKTDKVAYMEYISLRYNPSSDEMAKDCERRCRSYYKCAIWELHWNHYYKRAACELYSIMVETYKIPQENMVEHSLMSIGQIGCKGYPVGTLNEPCLTGGEARCTDPHTMCHYDSRIRGYACMCQYEYVELDGKCVGLHELELGQSCKDTTRHWAPFNVGKSCKADNSECNYKDTKDMMDPWARRWPGWWEPAEEQCMCKRGYKESGLECVPE